LSRDPKIGDVGQVDGAKVSRIVDEQTMIVDATEPYIYQRRQHTRTTGTYLVKGLPTAGLVDGKPAKLPKLMTITGTEQRGVKTYFVLEPVDVEAMRPEVDAYLKAKKRPKAPAKPTAKPRQ
jgi:hypothetical protein